MHHGLRGGWTPLFEGKRKEIHVREKSRIIKRTLWKA